jgi:hypothetical protein
MKKNLTETPQAPIKQRQNLFLVVVLIALMGLAIGVFSKSVQQLANKPNQLL